jgi:hypothetical protein
MQISHFHLRYYVKNYQIFYDFITISIKIFSQMAYNSDLKCTLLILSIRIAYDIKWESLGVDEIADFLRFAYMY